MNTLLNKEDIRETFGIIDPITKKPYEDILRSFLVAKRITQEDITNGYIFCNHKRIYDNLYKLSCDSTVRKEIKRTGECPCIISFQTRTDLGQIAFARIFDITRTTKS